MIYVNKEQVKLFLKKISIGGAIEEVALFLPGSEELERSMEQIKIIKDDLEFALNSETVSIYDYLSSYNEDILTFIQLIATMEGYNGKTETEDNPLVYSFITQAMDKLNAIAMGKNFKNLSIIERELVVGILIDWTKFKKLTKIEREILIKIEHGE